MEIFHAYGSYQAAGISWLSSVPSHWRTTRLKREAQIQTGVTLGKVYAVEVESRPYLRVANVQAGFLDLRRVKNIEVPRSEALKSELRPNDVVLTEGGDIDKLGRGAIWSGQIKGCIHQNHVFVVRPEPTTLSPKFLTYILESPHGRSYFQVTAKQTTNLAATNRSTLGRFPLFLPPRPEQDQIVAYLRAQDAHIARFIKAKRELIGLLTEQKLRIIDHAVTRGLDASVKLKPSGIEWLGEVPEHWETVRLRQLSTSLQTGPFGSQLHASDYIDGGIPVINPSHLKAGAIIADDRCSVDADTAARLSRHRLAENDVIFARRGELGRCALVTTKEVGWLCGTGSLRMRLRPDAISTDFLMLVLSSPGLRAHLRLYSVGSTMDNANTAIVGNIRVPMPPSAEQQAICRWITDECQPLDDAIARAEDEIKLIREYRDRLIADAVTGQVDVRGWQPGPDDAVSDDDLAALGDDEAETAEEDADGEEN